jgi:hypothetical protein
MTHASHSQPSIIRTERGLTIAGTQNHCGKFGSLVFAKRGGKTTRAVLTAVSLWDICTIDG